MFSEIHTLVTFVSKLQKWNWYKYQFQQLQSLALSPAVVSLVWGGQGRVCSKIPITQLYLSIGLGHD